MITSTMKTPNSTWPAAPIGGATQHGDPQTTDGMIAVGVPKAERGR